MPWSFNNTNLYHHNYVYHKHNCDYHSITRDLCIIILTGIATLGQFIFITKINISPQKCYYKFFTATTTYSKGFYNIFTTLRGLRNHLALGGYFNWYTMLEILQVWSLITEQHHTSLALASLQNCLTVPPCPLSSHPIHSLPFQVWFTTCSRCYLSKL